MKLALKRRSRIFWVYTHPSKGSFFSLLFLLTVIIFMSSHISIAQGITGTITGTVVDSSGAVVDGANVTIREINTNITHAVTTSALGVYKVTLLPPGTYGIRISQSGFKTVEQNNIVLQIGQTVLVDLQLVVVTCSP